MPLAQPLSEYARASSLATRTHVRVEKTPLPVCETVSKYLPDLSKPTATRPPMFRWVAMSSLMLELSGRRPRRLHANASPRTTHGLSLSCKDNEASDSEVDRSNPYNKCAERPEQKCACKPLR